MSTFGEDLQALRVQKISDALRKLWEQRSKHQFTRYDRIYFGTEVELRDVAKLAGEAPSLVAKLVGRSPTSGLIAGAAKLGFSYERPTKGHGCLLRTGRGRGRRAYAPKPGRVILWEPCGYCGSTDGNTTDGGHSWPRCLSCGGC